MTGPEPAIFGLPLSLTRWKCFLIFLFFLKCPSWFITVQYGAKASIFNYLMAKQGLFACGIVSRSFYAWLPHTSHLLSCKQHYKVSSMHILITPNFNTRQNNNYNNDTFVSISGLLNQTRIEIMKISKPRSLKPRSLPVFDFRGQRSRQIMANQIGSNDQYASDWPRIK